MSEDLQETMKRTSITLPLPLYKAVWREAIDTERSFNDVLIGHLSASYEGSPFFSPVSEAKVHIDPQEVVA